jgi:hypothetical protein
VNNISLISQTGVLNTGKNPVYLNPAIMVGALLVPYGWSVPINDYGTNETNINAVMAAIKMGLVSADDKQRIRYIGPFESVENQNEAVKVQTLGYGKKVTTDRAKKYDMFTFDEGGWQYFRYILSYRDKIRQFKLIYFDANGVLYPTSIMDVVSGDPSKMPRVVGVKGDELSRLYPMDWQAPTQDAEALYGIEIGLKNPLEWNENLLAIETGTDLLALCEELSVQGVELLLVDTAAGGEVELTMRSALGKIDLADELPDIIDVTSFVARNSTTLNAIDIDSVTYNPVSKILAVTLDTTDPDYVAGDNAIISLVGVTDLAIAGFKYYESNKMIFEMPAT